MLVGRMRVLVTGSNGHVGNVVVRELLRRGDRVVAMVREGADLGGHAGLALTYVHGDVLDAGAVERAMDGVDGVIHLAAVFALGARDADAIVKPAVQGAENVLRAAAKRKVRVVHCSSTYAVGFSTGPVALDETHWNERLDDPYAAAKTRSERRVWELARELGVEVVSINPNGIVGPHDHRKTPTHALLAGNVVMPAVRYEGGASFADVRDVATLLVAALRQGTPGERYIVSGENLTASELVEHLAARSGTMIVPSPLPRGLLVPSFYALEATLGLVGVQLPVSAAAADEFYRRWLWFDTTKAQRAFGWTPRPVRESIDRGLAWCVARGWIGGARAARITETIGAVDFG